MLSGASLVDNNLSLDERKSYLMHMNDCPACAEYMKRLQRDFFAIEKLIPAILADNESGQEHYGERVSTLAEGSLPLVHRRSYGHRFKRWLRAFKASLFR